MTNKIAGELTILDVGHGNSAFLRSDACIVIDAAPSSALGEEIERAGVNRLDHLILSHSDRDHIGGALRLLSRDDLDVVHLWLNPDAVKDSHVFEDLTSFAANMVRKGRLRVSTNLNEAANPIMDSGTTRIEVLHPDIEVALHGPVRAGSEGGFTSNSASAVIRIVNEGSPLALLPADMDEVAFRRLVERGQDLHASILVFPHHGGKSGGDDFAFARDLCLAVEPDIIVFSFGRTSFRNPLDDIVRGAKQGAPGARIVCTQLSRRCAEDVIGWSGDHLTDRPSSGLKAGVCCAGTVVVKLAPEGNVTSPKGQVHEAFIEAVAPQAMCIRY